MSRGTHDRPTELHARFGAVFLEDKPLPCGHACQCPAVELTFVGHQPGTICHSVSSAPVAPGTQQQGCP